MSEQHPTVRRLRPRKVVAHAATALVIGGLVAAVVFVSVRPEIATALTLAITQGEPDSAHSALDRFYDLPDLAKDSFNAGQIEDARRYAQELLALAPTYPSDWNYGNALHDGNMVLGRIAAREGRLDDAERYLLAAGATPGSPQLDSFGPNMSLAKDLLDKGRRRVVLEYFELCRKFWEMEDGKLDTWRTQVENGQIPDFRANLLY
ncbi:type IV pilus biogenesis/stability protein PilW [Nocardia sp. NPDC051570]|uniref:type IV pilus biogenesis/stability protein PilW n=1 Tax=Nocardia sp. NPDC051570 TaxID=3364324 RepID=UPI003791D26D